MLIKNQHKDLALSYIQRLSDVRFLGQVVFVVIVLLISWSGIKTIQTNYGLQKQISTIKQKNTIQKLQNENIELQNAYYKSNQYLEVAARQNFGLGAPGDKLIVVPEKVALANTIDTAPINKQAALSAKQPVYQRNFQSWVDFFLHRQNSN